MSLLSFIAPELDARGLVHQHTPGLARALAERSSVYCGLDPTANSLHVGHLLPLLTLQRLSRAGHPVTVLIGGATALVGDPTDRTESRPLLSPEAVAANASAIEAQARRLVPGARVVNNAEWFGSLTLLDFLRTVGRHSSMTELLGRSSVAARLASGAGVSVLEGMYSLLQATDFLELHDRHGVTLQLGGQDQWGNITAGTALVRRVREVDVQALTVPLLLDAQGRKFGKSLGEAVWLDPGRTRPFAFHQFWLGTPDAVVEGMLPRLSARPLPEVQELLAQSAADPSGRAAARALAADMTDLVHGIQTRVAVEEAAGVLFGRDLPSSDAAWTVVEAEAPVATLVPEDVTAQGVLDPVALLKRLGLASSLRVAREVVAAGGLRLNGAPVAPAVPIPVAGLPERSLLVKGKTTRLVLRRSA